MAGLRVVLREVVGLFVDDGLLALAILAVVGLCGWSLNDGRFDQADTAATLVGGCLLVLVSSIARAAYAARAKLAAHLDKRKGRP
jgi:hypothetical protein